MIAAALFLTFAVLFVLGAPIAVALGLAGSLAIWLADLGVLAVPTSTYTGIAKYPLLAIPMFVLLGSLFDRSGVAARLVDFTAALIGRRPGALAAVTVIVAMMLGGISGSGPANAAAVGGAMIGALSRAGYPKASSASVIGAAAATDILIPPSIALIIYSVLVPQASVPALFAAGMIPGILAGVALLIPIFWLSKKHGFGLAEKDMPRPPFWRSFRDAIWGLMAPVLILGGMRAGWFTPDVARRMAAWRVGVAERLTSDEAPVSMARLLNELNALLPADGILVADGGFAAHWGGLLYDTKQPGRGFVPDRGFASIGYGLPGAMGAALAAPGRAVVSLTGDGGFNMMIGELETARRLALDLTVIVVNNAASGYVKALQHLMYGAGAYHASDLAETNYAKVAEAMGCHGVRVERPADLAGALKSALAAKGPSVVDVVVTRDPAKMLPAVDNRTVEIKKGDRVA